MSEEDELKILRTGLERMIAKTSVFHAKVIMENLESLKVCPAPHHAVGRKFIVLGENKRGEFIHHDDWQSQNGGIIIGMNAKNIFAGRIPILGGARDKYVIGGVDARIESEFPLSGDTGFKWTFLYAEAAPLR